MDNPERYNAAYPDDPIFATRSMPFFIADHGWYVNGGKTDDPYPDIPEDYTVGPPEWALPPAETSVDEPYSGPLELDGTPVKIQPGSRWPVGYRREKDTWSIIQQERTSVTAPAPHQPTSASGSCVQWRERRVGPGRGRVPVRRHKR